MQMSLHKEELRSRRVQQRVAIDRMMIGGAVSMPVIVSVASIRQTTEAKVAVTVATMMVVEGTTEVKVRLAVALSVPRM